MKAKRLIKVMLLALLISHASADIVSVDGVRITSVLQLLAHPDRYEGKRVQVKGYYASGMEYSGLFGTKESAEIADIQSGIWLDIPSDKQSSTNIAEFTNGYVTIAGTFHYVKNGGVGHLGAWPASIIKLTLLVPAKREALQDVAR
jgi:hypothetical protein